MNSKLFYVAATSKKRANQIKRLHNEGGNVFEKPMCKIALDYFSNLLAHYEAVISQVKAMVSEEGNDNL